MQLRRKETTITRLRLGHSMTKAAPHKIGVRDNADCAIRRTHETTEHFLLTCAVQQHLQANLRRECIQIKKTYDFKTILTTTTCTYIIYDWIVSSKRHLYTIVFQPRALCDLNLHRKEQVVKHELRRG